MFMQMYVNAYTLELMNLFNCINDKPCITSLNHDISFTRCQGNNFSCIGHYLYIFIIIWQLM